MIVHKCITLINASPSYDHIYMYPGIIIVCLYMSIQIYIILVDMYITFIHVSLLYVHIFLHQGVIFVYLYIYVPMYIIIVNVYSTSIYVSLTCVHIYMYHYCTCIYSFIEISLLYVSIYYKDVEFPSKLLDYFIYIQICTDTYIYMYTDAHACTEVSLLYAQSCIYM